MTSSFAEGRQRLLCLTYFSPYSSLKEFPDGQNGLQGEQATDPTQTNSDHLYRSAATSGKGVK
jgi:hypothetical protein